MKTFNLHKSFVKALFFLAAIAVSCEKLPQPDSSEIVINELTDVFNITVNSPTNNSFLITGNAFTIEWTDNITENVTIDLYKAGILLQNISTLKSSQSFGKEGKLAEEIQQYSWIVPLLQTGDDYQIKISSTVVNTEINDFSDNFFIAQAPVIKAPVSSSNWFTGNSYTIEWTDDISENVSIDLYKAGVLLQNITSLKDLQNFGKTQISGKLKETIKLSEKDTLKKTIKLCENDTLKKAIKLCENDTLKNTDIEVHQYNWTVPMLQTGSDYQIKITNPTNTLLTDFSDIFTITQTAFIEISAPNQTSNWFTGTFRNIIWSDNITENVKIELYKAGTLNQVISSSTTSSGTYIWDIPLALTTASNYTIKISGVTNTSLIATSSQFTLTAPFITVTQPTAASVWQMGSQQNITWSDNIAGNVKIDLYENGVFVQTIIASTTSNGTYSWTLPTSITASTDYKIKISSISNNNIFGESANFSITEIPGITITAPTGTTNWFTGSTQNITWTDNISENVKIELYKAGTLNQVIISSTTSSGTYSWVIPLALTTASDYTIKISGVTNTSLIATSAQFTLTAPFITVTQPTAASVWQMGSQQNITWSDNIAENVKIDLYKAGVFVQTIIASTTSNGTYNWTLPTSITASAEYKIKISSISNNNIFGESTKFNITEIPNITVTAPTGTTNWVIGSTQNITWTDNISENVKIELYKAGALNQVITSSTTSSGTYSWDIPLALTTASDYSIKISSVTNTSLIATSAQFTLATPYISISIPNSSTNWFTGTTQNITWTDNISENVKIELYKAGALNQVITTSSESNGTYSWNIPLALTTTSDYAIKISSVTNTSIYFSSEQFSLIEPVEMVYVQGGSFIMGCGTGQNECWNDETPIHTVTLSNFYISKYEVTQAQYLEVMGTNPSDFTGDLQRPVEQVSWYDAAEFCNQQSVKEGRNPYYNINGTTVTTNTGANGYRLPTEAEWEYAARGGTSYTDYYLYSGSNNIGDVAWYYENSGNTTHAVGTKSPNQLDIYDMSGNVWEWCWDWFGDNYYSSSPNENPTGPSSGDYRVLRGGSWYGYDYGCRVAVRGGDNPNGRYYGFGFRLVLL